MDDVDRRLSSRRLPEGQADIRELHEPVAANAEEAGQVVVGIETDRGLWVQALRAAGYPVYAVPLAVPRRVTRDGLSKSHVMAFVGYDALVRLGASSCTIRVKLRRGTLPVPASSHGRDLEGGDRKSVV